MTTTKDFYAVEIGIYQPGGSSSSYSFPMASAPWGALALDPEPLEATGTLLVSDDGYTTLATDPDGVTVYPPLIREGFAIDRSLPLTPAEGSTVNWGSIQVIDPDDSISSLMKSWNIDGQTVTIRRGEKEIEDFPGYRSSRSTKGTYIDKSGVLQEAAALTVRWDNSTGSAVLLDEAARTNSIRNPRAEGATASSGTELVTNGTFALDPINASQNTVQNGWQWSRATGSSTATWGSGLVTLTPDGTNVRIDTSFTTTAGKVYVASADLGGNSVSWSIGTTKGGTDITTASTAAGTGRRLVFTASGTTTWMRFSRTPVGTTTIDNVSVKEAGTLPTYWAVSAGSSTLSYTVVGTGTENGVPYAEIRIAGLAAATTTYSIQFDSGISATKSDAWVVSAWTKLQSGSLTGVTSVALQLLPSTGTTITGTHTPTGTATRQNVAGTVSATATLTPQLTIGFNSGSAIDATFRIGAPQAELGAAVTSVILPPAASPAATLRAADALYTARGIWLSPSIADLDTVFVGMADTWQAAEDGITFPIRGADYWLDQPAQDTVYAGSGTYEGDSGLTGQPKPMGRGTFYNVEPVLINAAKLIYQYTDGAGTITGLFENGNAGIVFESDTSNLFSGTTTAGKYRTDNSRGLFQLGSAPAGQITIDGTGQFPTAGSKTVLADIARYVLTEELAIPSGFIDTASFSTAAASYPYAGGIWIGQNETGAQAVDRLLTSFGAKLVAGRDGKLRVVALGAPSGTPTNTLSTYNTSKVSPVALPASLNPPPYRVRCGYRHNYTVQTNVSASATAARVQFVGAQDRFATFADLDVLAAYRKPSELAPFGGCLDSSTDAQAVANRIGAMVSTMRRLYAVTVPLSIGTSIDLGDVITVIYPLDVLTGGALARVHREQFRSQSEVTFLVMV